jgi:ABC-type glycerol-3-phosphate transport system substrate-binding protein
VRFPLGNAILLLTLASIASGITICRRPAPIRPDLVLWTFAESHARTYRDVIPQADGRTIPSLADQFQKTTGLSVGISLIGQMGENVRLASAFDSHASGPQAPDLCEIEISNIGQFLRPPIDEIGLLPLNDYLQKSGWRNRIIAGRFAPWSKIDPRTGESIIYGIPCDVHPVTITYRKDLFDEAGVNLSDVDTWRQLQTLCLHFQQYWTIHGHPDRRALALSTASPDEIVEMLLQRHVNLIDRLNHLHFTDPIVLDTVMFYAQLVAGPTAVAADPSPGLAWTEDFARGNLCAVCTPDWKAQYMRVYAPELSGKVAMMPLPKFEPTDSPTSTFGGTMVGICRSSAHPDQAWKLLEFLLLSPQASAARIAGGDTILPAVPQYWTDPAYNRADPLFAGGQSIGNLYVSLAPQIPERFVTPYTFQAELALAAVLHRAEEFVDEHPSADGLKEACTQWLADAQDDIQSRIDFGNFKP